MWCILYNIIMQSRKFIILLIFLLFILTISSVSAKDLNTTDSVMLSQDSNQNGILDSSYVNQSISSSDENASIWNCGFWYQCTFIEYL